MKFLCLFALLGAACALKENYQYEYDYRGVVASGIPEIRPQISGTGIKAKLVLQMRNSSYGVAQLKNIEVGQYHDDLKDENLRIPLPINYSPLSQYSNQMEKPFSVYFNTQEGHVMDVEATDIEWMTNIRKSIVQMLYVAPLRPHDISEKRDKLAFNIEEETIFGRCVSQYLITPLTQELKEKVEREVERRLSKDEQKEKVQEKYYRMTRTIEFSKCQDRVILQFASAGNMSHIGSSQFKSVQSRSSIGTYILKGTHKNFRVERADVEGAIIVNPYGIKTEKLQTLTNQNLRLTSVSRFSSSLRVPVPTKHVKTWRYTVVSPYSSQSHPKPWVKYQSLDDKYFPIPPSYTLLGMKPSPELISKWKQTVLQLIQEVAEKINEIPDSPSNIPPMSSLSEDMGYVLTYKIYEASRLLRALQKQEIKEIFNQIFRDTSKTGHIQQDLLVDAVAASGSAASYKVLLDEMKSGKISDARMFSLFPPLTIHVNNPIIVEELMRFVMKLNPQTHPFLTAAAYNGFPTLVRRICMDHQAHNYSLPNDLFGKQVCDPKLIANEFIEHLRQKLSQASRFYEKAIYIQALNLIGTPHVLPTLKPIVNGDSESNARLRVIAINGLVKEKMPELYRDEIFDILNKIVVKLDEDLIVRQAAFTSLLTWHPDEAWWQTMGRLTWREPSRQMAAFIVLTMESLSRATGHSLRNQATYARFALHLVKPIAPSFKYAFSYIYDQYEPQIDMTTFASVAWLQNYRSQIPPVMWTSLTQTFGGMEVNWGDFGISQHGLSQIIREVPEFVREQLAESEQEEYYRQGGARSRENRRNIRSVTSWSEDKKSPAMRILEQFDALLFIRGWTNIRNMIPLNKHTLSQQYRSELLNQLRKGMRLSITKFFNSAENEYFLPTEIGLPVIGSISRPVLFVAHGDIKVSSKQTTFESLLQSSEIDFKSNTKQISKFLVKLRVLVPWNQKEVEAGLSQTHEFNLPVFGNFSIFAGRYVSNVSLNIAPYSDKKVPLFYMHNVPYTAIKSFVPTKNEQYKVITVRENEAPVHDQTYETDASVCGVKAVAKYYGDADFPLETGKPFEYLTNPSKLMSLLVSPTVKLYQASFIVDPSQSPVKNVSLSFSYMSLPNEHSSQRHENEVVQYLSKMTPEALKLYKEQKRREFDQSKLINIKLQLNSTDFYRVQDLVYMSQKKVEGESQDNRINKYKIDVAAFTSHCPYARRSAGVFLDLVYQTPKITTPQSLEQRLRESLREKYSGVIYYASPLDSKQKIASFTGDNSVTSERRNIVLKELQAVTESDSFDPTYGLSPAAVYDKGYFDMKYEQQSIPAHLVNFTSQLEKTTRGIMFPFVSVSDVEVNNERDTYKLSYFRPIGSYFYDVHVTKPRENARLSNIYVPFMFNTIVPFSGLQQPSQRRFGLPSTCNISIPQKKITSFDGVKIDFQNHACYTTVVKMLNSNALEKNYFEVFSRVSQNTMMVKVQFHEIKKVVEFTNTKLWVNGRLHSFQNRPFRMFDSNAKILIEIERTSSTHMKATVYSAEKKVVLINLDQDQAQYTPVNNELLHDNVRGICGDYDGLTQYDKTGPESCLFSDDSLFEYSWTHESGKDCDKVNLRKKMEEIDEFRQKCPHRQPFENDNENEFMYVYKIEETSFQGMKEICMPYTPVRHCKSGTSVHDYRMVTLDSKCWDEKSAPQEVKEAMKEKGYLLHPIREKGQYKQSVEYRDAIACSRH